MRSTQLRKVSGLPGRPVMVVLVAAIATVAALFGIAGASGDTYPPREPLWGASVAPRVEPGPELATRGEELFHIRCAGCHGLAGEGNGPAAELMQVKPRDLSEGIFKFRTTAIDGMPADEDLFRSITAGFPQYGMPSFRYLSVTDRWALVYHVKSLSPQWNTRPAGKPVDVGEALPATEQARARGEQLFRELKCTECHVGPNGEAPENRNLKDAWDHPIQPRDYRKGLSYFKAGGQPRDIARLVLTGIPGTPMASYADKIQSHDDLWALAIFVHSIATDGAAKLHEEEAR